jgi:hypothetical protein
MVDHRNPRHCADEDSDQSCEFTNSRSEIVAELKPLLFKRRRRKAEWHHQDAKAVDAGLISRLSRLAFMQFRLTGRPRRFNPTESMRLIADEGVEPGVEAHEADAEIRFEAIRGWKVSQLIAVEGVAAVGASVPG